MGLGTKSKQTKEKSKNQKIAKFMEKMTCTYYIKDPLALVRNMDSYFKQIPPDCSLFSDDEGKVYCGNHRIASQFFDSLKELFGEFGFPSRNFDFNGIILKSEPQDPSDNKVSSMFIASNVNKFKDLSIKLYIVAHAITRAKFYKQFINSEAYLRGILGQWDTLLLDLTCIS